MDNRSGGALSESWISANVPKNIHIVESCFVAKRFLVIYDQAVIPLMTKLNKESFISKF